MHPPSWKARATQIQAIGIWPKNEIELMCFQFIRAAQGNAAALALSCVRPETFLPEPQPCRARKMSELFKPPVFVKLIKESVHTTRMVLSNCCTEKMLVPTGSTRTSQRTSALRTLSNILKLSVISDSGKAWCIHTQVGGNKTFVGASMSKQTPHQANTTTLDDGSKRLDVQAAAKRLTRTSSEASSAELVWLDTLSSSGAQAAPRQTEKKSRKGSSAESERTLQETPTKKTNQTGTSSTSQSPQRSTGEHFVTRY